MALKTLPVIAKIINNRYEAQNLRGMTHITTNLTANEIRTTYGERVYDRLRSLVIRQRRGVGGGEMKNVISIPINKLTLQFRQIIKFNSLQRF